MLSLMFNVSGKQSQRTEGGKKTIFACYFFAYIISTIICARDLRFKDDQLELIGAKAANHLKVLFALLVQLIGDRKRASISLSVLRCGIPLPPTWLAVSCFDAIAILFNIMS